MHPARIHLNAVLVTSLLTWSSPLVALTDIEVIMLAQELGSMLASESMCGLSYDQSGIAQWIDANVPDDAIGFAASLSTMTQGQGMIYQDMTASAKTAHCAAIEQTARHLGFIK
jgi:hypothetical protein